MSLTILIAEDNESIAKIYEKALGGRGHKVTVTYNGEDCVREYHDEIIRQNTENLNPFDLVLMDQSMPKKDGVAAAHEILEMRPFQRILFATAYEDQILKQFYKIGREVAMLNKPFKVRTLIKSVESRIGAVPIPEILDKENNDEAESSIDSIPTPKISNKENNDEEYWQD